MQNQFGHSESQTKTAVSCCMSACVCVCVADYCAAFCTPCVSLSQYLNTVGEKLNPGIDVLWTGPKVVSQEISLASIEEVSAVLRRPPVIWDNIHANDYDPQRFFLGPYKNRPTALIPKLRGVLTNPNCEFELNFVALHTLAQWCRSRADSTGGDDPNSDYNPHDALQLALTDLLVEFGKSEHPSEQRCIRTPAAGENPLFHAEPLQRSDLTLLSELFYLPYEHGDTATRMLRELHWLITHSCSLPQSEEWHRRAKAFDQMCDAVVQMFNRLSNAANRLILYDLYNYICDIKSGVCLARAHVTALGGRDPHPALALTDDPEPWGFRGGLSGEFQRMLPSHGNRDLFRIPPKTRIYSIRAWTTRDQPEVMAIFQQKEMETQPKLQLLGDRLVTLEVSRSQDCSLILDDDSGVCGYGFALSEAKTALRSTQYPESLLKEFPSVLALQVHPRVPDHSAAKRLLDQLLSTLRDTGSRGVFSEFRSSDRRMLDFMKTLKGFSVLQIEGIPPELVIIGTKL
ncbi:hypothetical protein DNTS_032585 [Danionella cerebrum]|uniref:GH84 domain-containing protein n=1 Tax=Danionella cerebrum TaxID=2873325 RepID=A0A553PY90_9TELE|nr:hypothetical protein DNTS_032585 [Danionella translucida]